MRRWQVVLGAEFTGWSLSAHAAELGIAASDIASAGSEADLNEQFPVCTNPQVSWWDTRSKIANGETAPKPEQIARVNQCQALRRPLYPEAEEAGIRKGLRPPRAHYRQHDRRGRAHRQRPSCQGVAIQGARSARDDQGKKERA